jgi:mannose-6-phosphate isomerase-like protein (cupin superfamily)
MDEDTLNKETASYVERPWGKYFKLFQEPGVWVKRVEVNPDARLSLQKHARRSEKWIFVVGEGLAVVNNKEIPVKPGSVIDVPVGAVHRIGNTGSRPLVFIEVATGDYLAESDIQRIQDDYKRAE